MKRLAVALAVTLLLVTPGTTGARKASVAQLVTPAVIHVGDTFTVSGEAPLYADGTAKVNLCNPGCLIAFAAHWEAGIGTYSQVARFPGTYRSWFVGVSTNGRLFRTGEVSFEVLP